MDPFRLDGRVALVTGAARGIGQSIAEGLAEAGADVFALDILAVSDTRIRIESIGRRCEDVQSNLETMSSSGAESIVAECVAKLGRLDILVNNAGIIRRADALTYSDEDWHDVFQVNLDSAFYLSQAAARQFLSTGRGGKIVNVCSMLSFQGGYRVAAYTSAKSALAGLTRALANEWASQGINVNAIAPGYIETDVTAGIRADGERDEAVRSRIPAGRWGRPEDVKGAVVFLASDAAAYIHGTIIPVDGGWLAW